MDLVKAKLETDVVLTCGECMEELSFCGRCGAPFVAASDKYIFCGLGTHFCEGCVEDMKEEVEE